MTHLLTKITATLAIAATTACGPSGHNSGPESYTFGPDTASFNTGTGVLTVGAQEIGRVGDQIIEGNIGDIIESLQMAENAEKLKGEEINN